MCDATNQNPFKGNLDAIIKQFELCQFKDKIGNSIQNNTAFVSLKEMVDEYKSYHESLNALKEVHIQQDPLKTNDDYNEGLYDGLELALAIFEKRTPVFVYREEAGTVQPGQKNEGINCTNCGAYYDQVEGTLPQICKNCGISLI